MNQRHSVRLKACMEIAELLYDFRKVVEDDTCLERILTAVETILQKSSENIDILNLLSSLDNAWNVVKVNIKSYCCSSICYFVKLNSVLLVHASDCTTKWRSLLNFLVKFPELDSGVKHGEIQHGKWFSSSVGSSWLFAIKMLISVSKIFSCISSDLNLHHIVLLCEAPSIFVQKEASACMAEIGLALLKFNKSDVRRLYDAFSTCIMKQLSVTKVVIVVTKMLLIDHKRTIEFLSEITFSEYFTTHNSEFLDSCKRGEMYLPNFYEALFTSECTKSQTASMLEKVFHIEHALIYSITALTHSPTKCVVWKMLTSLLSYYPTLKDYDFDIGISIITFPMYMLFPQTNFKRIDNEDYTKWIEVVKSFESNKTKMSSIVSNCLSSTTTLWKFSKKFDDRNLPEKLLQLLCWIGSNHQLIDKDLPLGIQENLKVATSLLDLVEHCFFKLSQSEIKWLSETILVMIENPNIHDTIYCHCQKVISCIIETNRDDSQFLERCVNSASKKLLDRRWEMRDSALDHLSSLLLNCSSTSAEDNDRITQIYLRSSIHDEALRLALDKNSFVRANALMLMKNLFERTNLSDMASDNTLDLILKVITKDTEAVSRRSAVHTLLSYLQRERVIADYLIDAFSRKEYENFNTEIVDDSKYQRTADAVFHALYEDLDWEVKYNAIDILEHLVSCFYDINTSRENESCHKKDKLAFQSHFERLFDDCDAAVRDKAKSVYSSLFPDNLVTNPSAEDEIDVQIFQDMDDLLDEVLVSLRKDEQTRLTHGCHGPSINGDTAVDFEYDDSVIVDCY